MKEVQIKFINRSTPTHYFLHKIKYLFLCLSFCPHFLSFIFKFWKMTHFTPASGDTYCMDQRKIVKCFSRGLPEYSNYGTSQNTTRPQTWWKKKWILNVLLYPSATATLLKSISTTPIIPFTFPFSLPLNFQPPSSPPPPFILHMFSLFPNFPPILHFPVPYPSLPILRPYYLCIPPLSFSNVLFPLSRVVQTLMWSYFCSRIHFTALQQTISPTHKFSGGE